MYRLDLDGLISSLKSAEDINPNRTRFRPMGTFDSKKIFAVTTRIGAHEDYKKNRKILRFLRTKTIEEVEENYTLEDIVDLLEMAEYAELSAVRRVEPTCHFNLASCKRSRRRRRVL